MESGFSTVESRFLKRESEHESGFFPSPGFLRVRVRVRSGFRSTPFLLYENDLTSAVTDSNIKMFADDTKLFKEISSVADATQLDNDISNFQKSPGNAGLQLNISKCKSMQITRKHHPIEFTYKLQCANGEAVIERTEQERDLGVWTTSNLSWSKHVSEQCVRGKKMLGYIKRSTHNIKSLAARRMLYLSLVRPQLGYATQVWAPQSIELIARLEQIQRRALKYILDLPFITNTTYSQRLSQLQFLPLTYWHEYLDLIDFFSTQ